MPGRSTVGLLGLSARFRASFATINDITECLDKKNTVAQVLTSNLLQSSSEDSASPSLGDERSSPEPSSSSEPSSSELSSSSEPSSLPGEMVSSPFSSLETAPEPSTEEVSAVLSEILPSNTLPSSSNSDAGGLLDSEGCPSLDKVKHFSSPLLGDIEPVTAPTSEPKSLPPQSCVK